MACQSVGRGRRRGVEEEESKVGHTARYRNGKGDETILTDIEQEESLSLRAHEAVDENLLDTRIPTQRSPWIGNERFVMLQSTCHASDSTGWRC